MPFRLMDILPLVWCTEHTSWELLVAQDIIQFDNRSHLGSLKMLSLSWTYYFWHLLTFSSNCVYLSHSLQDIAAAFLCTRCSECYKYMVVLYWHLVKTVSSSSCSRCWQFLIENVCCMSVIRATMTLSLLTILVQSHCSGWRKCRRLKKVGFVCASFCH